MIASWAWDQRAYGERWVYLRNSDPLTVTRLVHATSERHCTAQRLHRHPEMPPFVEKSSESLARTDISSLVGKTIHVFSGGPARYAPR